ncbi:BON domain-containing protein [Lysobacter terrae]
MNAALKIVVAFAAGAAAMYYFDPVAGRRRRALARDQRVARAHHFEDFAAAQAKRAADRVRGAAARTRDAMSSEPIDDEVLRERIRSKLGHVLDHPGQIEVQVRDGHVLLTGHAHDDEIDEVIAVVAAMRGVVDVDSRLSSPAPADESSGSSRQDARH